MEKKCEMVERYGAYDTAGFPVKTLICYCGTTACNNFPSSEQFYPLPKDFYKLKELTQIEEEKFYKKVFKTKLL